LPAAIILFVGKADTATFNFPLCTFNSTKRRYIMELKDILAKCDHTLLAQTATWEDIKAICDDGMKYSTASVCIPASFVKQAKEYVGERLAICRWGSR
jgi:hypothetical protein